MTHTKYILPIITSAIIGVSVYALTPPTPSLQEQAEIVSKEKLDSCMSEIREEMTFAEEQKILRKCSEIKPIIILNVEDTNTGTHSTGITVLPSINETKNTGATSSKGETDVSQTLRKQLGIPDTCERELNFNTKHKIRGIEWLAYDIPPCEKGKSIKVKSPPGMWAVEKVGYGTNLGDFIILKKGAPIFMKTVRIVLGHTKSEVSEGEIVTEGTLIGKTNISGSTTGMHLHVELWEGNSIVSRDILWGGDYSSEDKSDLLTYRKWDFSK